MVVHCSDPRYQPYFQNFLRDELKIDRYALIAIPGGAQLLTPNDLAPKFAWACWQWTKFMVGQAQPERCILIAHEDCRWYAEHHLEPDPARIKQREIEDLRRVRSDLLERFTTLRVELYFATLAGDV
ncbi:MAG: hypothetical protein HY046_06010, partial [Acidobacteria bacterium]|nr:hypothetical protein [Acidobacteriota bacterium]